MDMPLGYCKIVKDLASGGSVAVGVMADGSLGYVQHASAELRLAYRSDAVAVTRMIMKYGIPDYEGQEEGFRIVEIGD